MDALILFEATLIGRLAHIPRRPHDRERPHLIRSGNIFIYEEHSSGIKRWTDGVAWSPSRILGNFLIYRELDKPFQPGEKKRAMKRNKTDGVSKHTSQPKTRSYASGTAAPQTTAGANSGANGAGADRAYIGSLVDSYQFKENGLIKKTISVEHNGVYHHLVSYYSLDDIKNGRLQTVRSQPMLHGISPRYALVHRGNFRAPVDDTDFNVMDTRQLLPIGTPMEYALLQNLQVRPISMQPGQPYVHPQAWNPAQYGHSPGYTLPQMPQAQMQQIQQMPHTPTTHYGTQLMPPYPYETSFAASSRSSGFSSVMQPARQHSVVPSSNGTNQLGYTPPLLTNGSSLNTIASSPYMNGGMFGVSAANAAAEGTITNSSHGNDNADTIDQGSGTNGINTPIPHGPSEFDERLSGGFENPMNPATMHNFGNQNYGPANPNTPPNAVVMGLDHVTMGNAGLPSPDIPDNPDEIEWNRTVSKDSQQW
ncbi:Gti1/Pac2 family-domain-containing protein [Xylaria telfairii]|nr:Gti1/Pac2 family-domain-containing protein [Xylaria telfairii]